MEKDVVVLIRVIWHRVNVNVVFSFGCGEFIDRLTDQ